MCSLLSRLAGSIHREWLKRHTEGPLEVAAASILGVGALKPTRTRDVVEPTRGAGDIFNESSDEEDQGGFSAEKRERLKKLQSLIQMLPVRHAQKFDPLLIFPGLESWLGYLKEKLAYEGSRVEENTCYEGWYKKHILCEDPLECNLLFSRLFQNLQVRSTTEAMAETVGSIMNQHLGKNR